MQMQEGGSSTKAEDALDACLEVIRLLIKSGGDVQAKDEELRRQAALQSQGACHKN